MKLNEIIQKYRDNSLIFELGQIIYTDDNEIVTEQIVNDYIILEDEQRKKESDYWQVDRFKLPENANEGQNM